MTAKQRGFTTVSATTPSADRPTPEPAPAPIPSRAVAPVPDPPIYPEIPSKEAGNIGQGMTFSAASLVAGFPDPREDLVTVTLSLPREVVQALDIQNRMTRKPKKNIVMDALYAHLSARLIAEVRATLYPGRA